jgi:hypothetical protein
VRGYIEEGTTTTPFDMWTSVFRTVTRVRTTDPQARRMFRRYWSTFSPGILLIRREALRVVRAEAERRHRESTGAITARTSARAIRAR